jgi:hypothetical protein
MATPQKPHMEAIKRIFKYFHGIIDFGLMFTSIGKIKLEGFVDADWANDINITKSIVKYTFQLGGSSITWSNIRLTNGSFFINYNQISIHY